MSPRANTTHPRNARRAFAFIMVVLLMLVVSMGIGLAMMRFSAQTKSVTRQVSKYQEHHLGRGLQEAIGAWLRQQNGRDLHEALEPETGHAMDIILADGSEVSVFLRDAQGAALSNLTNESDVQIEEGGIILRNLASATTEEQYLRETRPFGPFNISIASASDIVLQAAAQVVAGGLADRFLAELGSLRENPNAISRTELTRIATASGLDSEQRAALFRVFATDIELWAVIIEVRAGGGMRQGQLIARYGGVTNIRSSSTNRSGNPTELGAFITWRELELDQQYDLSQLY
ncbi:MAG: hypothetical protein JJ916_11065 [Phycisphaerales bacterium]|nr:hypothetical protein [Phycisphaerales bacterium]